MRAMNRITNFNESMSDVVMKFRNGELVHQLMMHPGTLLAIGSNGYLMVQMGVSKPYTTSYDIIKSEIQKSSILD